MFLNAFRKGKLFKGLAPSISPVTAENCLDAVKSIAGTMN